MADQEGVQRRARHHAVHHGEQAEQNGKADELRDDGALQGKERIAVLDVRVDRVEGDPDHPGDRADEEQGRAEGESRRDVVEDPVRVVEVHHRANSDQPAHEPEQHGHAEGGSDELALVPPAEILEARLEGPVLRVHGTPFAAGPLVRVILAHFLGSNCRSPYPVTATGRDIGSQDFLLG